jgi:hypothetical protein
LQQGRITDGQRLWVTQMVDLKHTETAWRFKLLADRHISRTEPLVAKPHEI